ncbi:MAG: hypothetical protein KKH98_15560 [Spirochaetes bacterium]|nr:hypothetical protein [Spirochaetota bacterium]
MKDEKLKELFIYTDLVVLKKIEMILSEKQIRFMVRSYEDAAYDGLFTLAKGKGKILVFEKDHSMAESLLIEENIL